MQNRTTDGGYKLPAVTDPERVCIKFEIPNDYDHIRAFWAALWELTWWSNWERDPDKRGKDVAAIWKGVLFTAQELNRLLAACGEAMDVRQSPENPCVLEKSLDGAEWLAFADLQLCMPNLIVDPLTGEVQFDDPVLGPTSLPMSDPVLFDETQSHGSFGRPRTEPTETDRQCLAAANLAFILHRLYDDVRDRMAETIFNEIDLAESVFGVIMRYAPDWLRIALGFPVAGFLIAQEAEMAAHPFTDEAEEELKCIALEHITAATANVTVDYMGLLGALAPYGFGNFPELDLLRLLFPSVGGDGLNIAASMNAITTADCDCLGACQAIARFTSDLSEILVQNSDGNPGYATWQAAGGHDNAGCLGPQAVNGTQQTIVFRLDLGADCAINTCSFWIKLHDYSSGYRGLRLRFFTEGGGFQGQQIWDITEYNVWQNFTYGGITPVARYVCFDLTSYLVISTSSLFFDDLEINISE